MAVRRGPKLWGYLRYSDPRQRFGRSEARQDELLGAYALQKGLPLDRSLEVDKGLSAYTGDNVLYGALGLFLRWIASGRVQPGDYLVVENLDRLTRQHERKALLLLLSIIDAGVTIVALQPRLSEYGPESDTGDLFDLHMCVSRNHHDSKSKAVRINDARAKERARMHDGEKVRQRGPSWLRWGEAGWELIPDRAAVIVRVARECVQGVGTHDIADGLNRDGVPTFKGVGRWSAGFVAQLLRDGRAAGEHRPRSTFRQSAPEPIAAYYPAAIDATLWAAVRRALEARRTRPGRTGGVVNLFAGLLVEADTGEGMWLQPPSRPGREPHSLRADPHRRRGGGVVPMLPYAPFERAVLSRLSELDDSVMDDDQGAADCQRWEEEVRSLEKQRADIQAAVLRGFSETLEGAARAVDAALSTARAAFAEADDRRRASPVDDLHSCQSIIARLDAADDRRAAALQLRAAIRLVVRGMRVLTVKRGAWRAAWLQMTFVSGRKREYLYVHKRATGARGGVRKRPSHGVASYPVSADDGRALDLTRPADRDEIRARLCSIDPLSVPQSELP